jgi:hypothetical protein
MEDQDDSGGANVDAAPQPQVAAQPSKARKPQGSVAMEPRRAWGAGAGAPAVPPPSLPAASSTLGGMPGGRSGSAWVASNAAKDGGFLHGSKQLLAADAQRKRPVLVDLSTGAFCR